MTARRDRSASLLAAIVIAAGLAAACAKNKPATESPTSVVADDIGAIEAQLDANAAELHASGIAEPASPGKDPAGNVPADPSPGPAEGGGDAPPPSDEDDGAGAEARETQTGSTGTFKASDTRPKRSRCERICDLAITSCDLRERICDLASAHASEIRYSVACERATGQCSAATEACGRCRGC